jgi:hypothetical protein
MQDRHVVFFNCLGIYIWFVQSAEEPKRFGELAKAGQRREPEPRAQSPEPKPAQSPEPRGF